MPGDDGPNAAALFEAANKLRGSVESADYKHLVLGLIFAKAKVAGFTDRELAAEPGSSLKRVEATRKQLSRKLEAIAKAVENSGP